MKVAAIINTMKARPITIPGSYVSYAATCVYEQSVPLAFVIHDDVAYGIKEEYPIQGYFFIFYLWITVEVGGLEPPAYGF